MKKLQPTCIALAALCLAQGAAAQSTVTLSGIADSAVRRVHNDGLGSVTSLVSGSNSTSRLIFRGVEDLGGGLSAGFHLEHGLLIDMGIPAQQTQFWDRRSTVSLVSTTWGEVRAGRDFVPSYVGWTRYDPFSYVGVGGSNNFVSATPLGPIRTTFGSGFNTTVRSSNAVQYLLPNRLGGFEGGLMFAFHENGTAANGQHRVNGLLLGYVSGPLDVSMAHTRSHNDLTAVTGSPFRDTAVGGSWNFGAARVALAARRFEQGTSRQTHEMVAAWVPVGAGEVKVSWLRAHLSGTSGTTNLGANGARQVAVGYVHNLSKRTALYATMSRIGNRGASTYVVPGGPTSLAAGGASTGTEFGIRHSF